ncbi:MAG: hypothetical protein ACPKOI_06240 [Pleomorphochaeta sp.]|jgi:hypothetical protein
MKYKLITLKLNDQDLKYIKTIKRSLFSISNDPSFNIFPSLVVLGKTDLNNLNNVDIPSINSKLVFNNNIESNNKCSFIRSEKNEELYDLINQICLNEDIKIYSKYFNLLQEFNNLPIIHLGNSNNIAKEIKTIIIKDYRLELIEININDNFISYKIIDSLHLS